MNLPARCYCIAMHVSLNTINQFKKCNNVMLFTFNNITVNINIKDKVLVYQNVIKFVFLPDRGNFDIHKHILCSTKFQHMYTKTDNKAYRQRMAGRHILPAYRYVGGSFACALMLTLTLEWQMTWRDNNCKGIGNKIQLMPRYLFPSAGLISTRIQLL